MVVKQDDKKVNFGVQKLIYDWTGRVVHRAGSNKVLTVLITDTGWDTTNTERPEEVMGRCRRSACFTRSINNIEIGLDKFCPLSSGPWARIIGMH